MSLIRKIDATEVVYEEQSDYSGISGMRTFRNCVGMPIAEPGRGSRIEHRIGSKIPPALFDLIEEGGFVSSWANFADNVDRVGLLSEVGQKHIDYLRLSSRTVYDKTYRWFESKKFAEEYHLRRGTDGTSLACDSWFPRMLLLGEGRYGELFMANPVVKTCDGEWEGWLWCHSYPGAYRFPSVAELVGHCYLESRNESGDCPRFGRPSYAGTCAQWLVRQA